MFRYVVPSTLVAVAFVMAAASAQQRGAPGAEADTAADQPEGDPTLLKAATRVAEEAQTLTRVLAGQVATARKRGDIILVTCLTDKRRRAQATLSAVRERTRALKRALSLQQRERAHHEHVVLTVLSQQLGQVRREAEQCVGQDLYAYGAAQTVTAVDEGTTDVDPLEPPQDENGLAPGSVAPPRAGAAPDLDPVLPPPVSPVM